MDGYHYDTFFRGTYIENKVYTLTESTVKEFDMESCKKLRTLVYDARAEEESETALKDDWIAEEELDDETLTSQTAETIPFDPAQSASPVLIDETTTALPTTQAP